MKRFIPNSWSTRGKLFTLLGVILCSGIAYLWWCASDPERRFGWMGNHEAHCTGCGMFLQQAMRHHAQANDGWHLRGTPGWPNSLTNLLPHGIRLRHLSSHGFTAAMFEHFDRTGSLSAEHICYRYNEGLRNDDSEELILMYYHRPTVWKTRTDKGSFLGRNVLEPTTWIWTFVPEAEFQRRQRATLDLLHERKSRATDIAFIRSNLILSVSRASKGTNTFRFTASLENRSAKTISVRAVEPVFMTVVDGGGRSGYKQEMGAIRKQILSGKTLDLPGWIEVGVHDTPKLDGGFHRRISRVATNRHGNSSGTYPAGTDLEEENRKLRVQARFKVTAETEELKPIILMLLSREVRVIP